MTRCDEVALGCEQCGIYAAHEPCPDCNEVVHVGRDYRCPHEPVRQISSGFDSYIDEHIDPSGKPAFISNPGDKKKFLKRQWENDNLIQIVEKR